MNYFAHVAGNNLDRNSSWLLVRPHACNFRAHPPRISRVALLAVREQCGSGRGEVRCVAAQALNLLKRFDQVEAE